VPPSSRASVLIVDDEASIRASLRMTLEFEGYRVEEAGSGAEALRIVRDRRSTASKRCARCASAATTCRYW
jgi:CheY-like chemotaxis protein